MTLKLADIEFKAQLPHLPKTVAVFELTAPTFEERRPAIGRLAEHLGLTDLRAVQLDHGTVMAGKQGDITVFHASGAVWARDARASQAATDEMRRWDGQVDTKVDGHRIGLSADASRKLIARARDVCLSIGLLGKDVASESVQLDQVAQLDAKGKEIAHGAGSATVKFSYAAGGIPVRGAGAKTMAFVEPGDGQPRFSGVFHAWRNVGKSTSVRLGSLEEALAAGLLIDPEFEEYHAAGHKIQVTRLDFAYLALPAFMRQSHLIPAFQVEGVVSKGKLGISFNFGRFHHAVSPKAYAAAELYGTCLTVNPDGIAANAGRNDQR